MRCLHGVLSKTAKGAFYKNRRKIMQPLLSIKELSIVFNTDDGNTIAVKNSNFSVDQGEIVAIVGESGSGKSVTALSFLQLLPKQATIDGEILFHQQDGTTA